MQCPILRLCNYALKICPAMPSLNASRPQYLNGIGGRRHEGAARWNNKIQQQQRQQQQPSYPRATPLPPDKGVFFDERLIPQFVGGVHHLKSPLLPPNPAIPPYAVRTPHPGITDDPAHITNQRHTMAYMLEIGSVLVDMHFVYVLQVSYGLA